MPLPHTHTRGPPTPTCAPRRRRSIRLPALVALVATQIGLLSTSLSLPMLAPLLLGTGMLMRSIRTNASLVFPRIGLLVVLLWTLWFANSVIQNTVAYMRKQVRAGGVGGAGRGSSGDGGGGGVLGVCACACEHLPSPLPCPAPCCSSRCLGTACPTSPPHPLNTPSTRTPGTDAPPLLLQGAIDQRLANNINSCAELTVLVTAGVILLSMLGVNVSALLLPAGVAAALAARDLTHNFLAGFFLMMVQPFRCVHP